MIDLMRRREKIFPISEVALDTESLRIWFCKYRSLSVLSEYTFIRQLVVAGVPDNNLHFLSGMQNLEYLRILDIPKVEELEVLADLKRLKCLSLATCPSWDSQKKYTIVDSISPIVSAGGITHLELLGVKPRSGSIDYLANLKNLKSLRLSGFSAGEVGLFKGMSGVSS